MDWEPGQGVFTGEYRHAIDAKGRLAVPARFRAELAGDAYVCRWLDGCLAIFPRAAWEELAGRIRSLATVGDTTARSFARHIFSSAFPIELDAQGRVLLPAALRESEGLATEAVVVGLLDHVELWPPQRWAQYTAGMADADEFATRLAGLGI